MPTPVERAFTDYATVAASHTGTVLGATGATGDYLDGLTVIVATASTASVALLDGATSISIFPASPGGGIGSYYVPIRAKSKNGPWSLTTGAGVSVLASGKFT